MGKGYAHTDDEHKFLMKLSQMEFEGNVIPNAWFRTIKNPKTEKADHTAIILLSEIVYWYRPISTNKNNEEDIFKKYSGDLLQKSYAELADKFGLSKRQVKESLEDLEGIGVIEVIVRNGVRSGGSILSGVTYIKLNPDRLLELTYPDKQE